jgi:hypothetical protein
LALFAATFISVFIMGVLYSLGGVATQPPGQGLGPMLDYLGEVWAAVWPSLLAC